MLLSDEEAPEYRQALAAQMAVAQAIVSGLGYRGEHFRLIDIAATATLARSTPLLRRRAGASVARAGSFAAQADKRATLDLAIDHLLAQAPQPRRRIALPAAGSPFGSLLIDAEQAARCA